MAARLEAIRPRKSPAYSLQDFDRAMKRALKKTATEMIRDFKRTTATWETDVKFEVLDQKYRVGSRIVSITVGTTNDIYRYVSRGTEPHIIRAKNAPRLLFRTGYKAKSKPGRFLSKPSERTGDWVSPMEVQHPGTEARKFEELVQERHQKRGTLQKHIQHEWDKLAKKR